MADIWSEEYVGFYWIHQISMGFDCRTQILREFCHFGDVLIIDYYFLKVKYLESAANLNLESRSVVLLFQQSQREQVEIKQTTNRNIITISQTTEYHY